MVFRHDNFENGATLAGIVSGISKAGNRITVKPYEFFIQEDTIAMFCQTHGADKYIYNKTKFHTKKVSLGTNSFVINKTHEYWKCYESYTECGKRRIDYGD